VALKQAHDKEKIGYLADFFFVECNLQGNLPDNKVQRINVSYNSVVCEDGGTLTSFSKACRQRSN
jgi:hypothetical protein